MSKEVDEAIKKLNKFYEIVSSIDEDKRKIIFEYVDELQKQVNKAGGMISELSTLYATEICKRRDLENNIMVGK